MKYTTEDKNDIRWMNDPDSYGETGKTIRRIMDAGKWDEFCEIHADPETGEVDCDSLYDYLRHESGDALQDVGLHEMEATATVAEVIAAWEEDNAPAKVKRNADGKPCVSMMTWRGHTTLDFDAIDEDGEEASESLYEDDVVGLMRDKHYGNATTGEWDCEDPDCAEFEMWRGRE